MFDLVIEVQGKWAISNDRTDTGSIAVGCWAKEK